jgi:putative heme iron utilization protein
MAADPLTPAVSDRICQHMNTDHAAAVLAYARHYGGITLARQARMLAVGTEAMRLEVDGTPVEVPFDHSLQDSEDAHRTLVAMLRSLPAEPTDPSPSAASHDPEGPQA